MKRLISLAMATMMVGSLLPMSAFANASDGWHYTGSSVLVDRNLRTQKNGSNNFGINIDTELVTNKDYAGLTASGNLSNDDIEPWEIATANAPDLQIGISTLSPSSSGSLVSDKPYIVSEFEIEIDGAALVQYDYTDNNKIYYKTLSAEDILHLVSITRDDVEYSMRDIMAGQAGDLSNGEGRDVFPDIYVTDINTRTVSGQNGVISFKLEVRSNATTKAFDSAMYTGDTHSVTSEAYANYTSDTKHNPSFDATGEASKNDAVSGSLLKNDIISIQLPTYMKSASNSTASISVESDDFTINSSYDYASLVETGMTVTYTRGKDSIAEGERITLSGDVIIREAIAGSFDNLEESAKVTFKLNKGFEFYFPEANSAYTIGDSKYDAINTDLMKNLVGGLTYYTSTNNDINRIGWHRVGENDMLMNSGTNTFTLAINNGKDINVDTSADSDSTTNPNGTYDFDDGGVSKDREGNSGSAVKTDFTDSSSILETLRVNATTFYNPTTSDQTYILEGGIGIEATTAGIGDVATLTIEIDGIGISTIEVAQVIENGVTLTVDSSKDVPIMFSGVNRDNDGLTTHSRSNYALEVTIEETFPGAWNMAPGFTIGLPDGVTVVNDEDYDGATDGSDSDGGGVVIIDVNNLYIDTERVDELALYESMEKAYSDGDYENFEFGRRPFDSSTVTLSEDVISMTFQLVLTADMDFEGDVELSLDLNGDESLNPAPVTIATFVKPFEISAEQNDVIIDYRNYAIDSEIKFVEYEAGLLTEINENLSNDGIANNQFEFFVDRGDYIQFDAASVNVDGDSGASLTGEGVKSSGDSGANVSTADLANGGGYNDVLRFRIDEESTNVPLEVTIDGMELFMQRSIPAGSYDLTFTSNMNDARRADNVFGGYDEGDTVGGVDSLTAEEKFINVITAGSDKDNTFLTQIIVPIGQSTIYSGGNAIDLNATEGGATPAAYINADGFTMIPVRAVSEAFGDGGVIVTWSGETKTATIISGTKAVAVTVGSKEAVINGTVSGLNAALEIVDGRAFLPFRDLGNLLGVADSDINWDPISKTAILNGSVEEVQILMGTTGSAVEEVVVEDVVEEEEA